MPTCRTWHLSRLKGICQTVDHSPMAGRSLCRALTDSGFAALIPSLVSSANLDTLLERPRSRSLIYMTKRGPRTNPWGTPLLKAVQSEGTPLTMTLSLLPAQDSILEDVLNWCYSSITDEHQGSEKTLHIFRRYFWNKCEYSSVNEHTQKCVICKKCNSKPSKDACTSYPMLARAFQAIVMDMIGPIAMLLLISRGGDDPRTTGEMRWGEG